MAKNTKKSAIDSLYQKYEYIAKSYADRIFNFERFGYEKTDILQEFKIKIYTSIVAYTEKWSEYRLTGKYKPIPLEFYLKSCMKNKEKDFIKLLNMERVESVDKISIENEGFDYSIDVDITSVLSLNENICEINGVDFLQGLVGRKKEIFSRYLSGESVKELSQAFPNLDVENVIERQIETLQVYKNQVYDYNRTEYSMMEAYED